MRYVVVDLEATCWENDGEFQRANSEVIEIGAAAMTEGLADEFDAQFYIQPWRHPKLTDYCINLTGITQEIVDKAEQARFVYPKFIEWLSPEFSGSTMVAWGAYDSRMLMKEMKALNLRFPFNNSVNLKQCFAEYEGSRPKGLHRAIESLGWTFQGRHHSGLADARNTRRILRHLLKEAKHVVRPSPIFR